MQNKGISPLIATVILVAIVVAVAAITSQFLTSFQQARQTEIEEEGSLDCTFATIEIDPDSVIYNSTGTEIIVSVENKGSTDVALKELIVSDRTTKVRTAVLATRKKDNSLVSTSNPLKEGSIDTIHNTSVSTRPDHRITVTTNCPGVTSTVENKTDSNKYEHVFD